MTSAPNLKTIPALLDLQRERCRRSFYEFFKEFWEVIEPAEPYTDNWHLEALCNHVQAWIEGRIKNLSIEIGPGFAKSLVFAVAAPAWAWIDRPWMRIAFSTYEAELTERDSARCRELIQSPKYQEFYGHIYSLKADRNRIKFFENTRGGNRRATSVSGGATGHRVHRFVGDDLLNATEAHSAAARRDVKVHLRAMSSRGVRQSEYGRALIGQRLHEEDAGGYAREHRFEVLCLPTEFDPARRCETTLGFKDPRTVAGELLFPQRFGPVEVADAKNELGPYGYSAQHQQLPVPAGGGTLKRAWWIDCIFSKLPTFHTIFQTWDTAYTKNIANDQSAVVTIGVGMTGAFVLDAKGFHLEMPQLLEQMQVEAELAERQFGRIDFVLVEAKANGLSIIHTLEQSDEWLWKIVPISPTLDKDSRGHAVAPYVARGLVHVPSTQPFAKLLFEQTDVFPNAKLRDMADSLVQGLLYAFAGDKDFTGYTFGTAVAPAFTGMELAATPTKTDDFNKAPVPYNYFPSASEDDARNGLF